MNITYNSTICSLLKDIRNEVNRWRDDDDAMFLCNMFASTLADLVEEYIENNKCEIEFYSLDSYIHIKNNLDKFIPEFNRNYAEKLGFITDYAFIWFNNNKERVAFLDNLISIYKNKRTTIKTLIKQFIETYEKGN